LPPAFAATEAVNDLFQDFFVAIVRDDFKKLRDFRGERGCTLASWLRLVSRGDELVGLTRAFIYAGTPSVVASLWKVDDASTAQLMSGFYRNLKTKSKIEALRQAQLDMIRGKGNSPLLAQRGVGGIGKLGQSPVARSSHMISNSHPYFWAPFILVGDGK